MIRTALHSTTVLAATAAAAALITACSSGGGGNAPSPSTSPAAGTSTTVAITLSHGHLVGPDGRTLYSNSADTATHLICTGSCLTVWPPVLGKAHAGAGVSAHDLGTVSRGSSTQVTFQGHPLYEFSSDSKPGDELGDGLTDQGGTWHPAAATAAAPASPAPSSGGGGGGYGYP